MSTQTFFLLSDIDLPVTVKIGVLENVFLTLDAQSAAEVHNFRLKNGFLGMASKSNDIPFYISAQLFSSGHPLGPPVFSTLLSAPASQPPSPLSTIKPKPIVVDQWLSFIARYKDLSPSSTVCFIIHKLASTPVAPLASVPVAFPVPLPPPSTATSTSAFTDTPLWLDPSVQSTPVLAVSMPLFNKSGKIKQHSRILKFSEYFAGFALNPPSYKPFASTPLGISHNVPNHHETNDTNTATHSLSSFLAPSTATNASFSFFSPSRPSTSSLSGLIRDPSILSTSTSYASSYSSVTNTNNSSSSNTGMGMGSAVSNDWLSSLSVKTLPHVLSSSPLQHQLLYTPTLTITLSPFSHPVVFSQSHTSLPPTVICSPPSISGRTFAIDDMAATLPSSTLIYESTPPRYIQMQLKQLIVRILSTKVGFSYPINANTLPPSFFLSGKSGKASNAGENEIFPIPEENQFGTDDTGGFNVGNDAVSGNNNFPIASGIGNSPISTNSEGTIANNGISVTIPSSTTSTASMMTGMTSKSTNMSTKSTNPTSTSTINPSMTTNAGNFDNKKHPFTFYQNLLTNQEKSYILQWPEWIMKQKSGWLLFSLCVDWENALSGSSNSGNMKNSDGNTLTPGITSTTSTSTAKKTAASTTNANAATAALTLATSSESSHPYTTADAYHLFSHAKDISIAECIWALWYGPPQLQYYAGNLLWKCTENELVLYLLQLVQCLRRGVIHNIQRSMYNGANMVKLGKNRSFSGKEKLSNPETPFSQGSPHASFASSLALSHGHTATQHTPAHTHTLTQARYSNQHLHISSFPSAESQRNYRAYLVVLSEIISELYEKNYGFCRCVDIPGYHEAWKLSTLSSSSRDDIDKRALPLSSSTSRNCRKCLACNHYRIYIHDDDIATAVSSVHMTIPALSPTSLTPPLHYYPHLDVYAPLVQVLITKACCHEKICSKLYWLLSTEIDGSSTQTSSNSNNSTANNTPAYTSDANGMGSGMGIGMNTYTNTGMNGIAAMFTYIRDVLLDTLSVTTHGRRWKRSLLDQKKLLTRTVELYQHPSLALSTVDQKITVLRQLLTDNTPTAPFADLITFTRQISLPLLPEAKVVGMVGSKCSMFKSAKRPILATYVLAPPMPMVATHAQLTHTPATQTPSQALLTSSNTADDGSGAGPRAPETGKYDGNSVLTTTVTAGSSLYPLAQDTDIGNFAHNAGMYGISGKSPLFGMEKPWYDSCDPHAGFQQVGAVVSASAGMGVSKGVVAGGNGSAMSTSAGAGVDGDGSNPNSPHTDGTTITNSDSNSNSNALASPATAAPAPASLTTVSAAGPRTSLTSGSTEYRSIFKCGDDLRQDQLVCNMFRLFDLCNLRYGVNANVTNYNVVATSANSGWVEMISGSVTLENIVHEYDRNIRDYLALSNTNSKSLNVALQRLLKSSAAYCVMTRILGVGDRHMENILVCKDGHLAHIDFGFLFGRDPKPWQPPIKLTKEMVNAMGGERSNGYVHFLEYCSEFTWNLRKHALEYKWCVDVMAGAGLECFIDKNNTGYNVMMTIGHPGNKTDEEESEFAMVELLATCQRAVMGILNDKIHTFAVSWK